MKELFTLRSLLKLALLLITANALISGIKLGAQGVSESRFQPVAYIAVTVGFALGAMKISTRRAWSIVLISGLFIIILEAGRLHEPVVHLLKSLPVFEFEAFKNLLARVPIDTGALKSQLAKIQGTADTFLKLLFGANRSPEKTLIVREVLWDILIHFLCAWSGWWTVRNKAAFIALLPSLALQTYILYYTKEDSMSLQVSVFVLLFLMGITHKWNFQSTPNDQAARAKRETYSAVFFLALVATLAAGFVPPLSVWEVAEKLSRRGGIGEALGLQGTATGGYTTSGLPRSHLVGANPFISQNRVFSVKTGELPASESAILNQAVPRHYWRWLVYDEYDGRGWSTSQVKSEIYPANNLVFPIPFEGYRVLHQQVEKANPKDTRLYWEGQLLGSDAPFETAWRVPPGSGSDLNPLLASDMMGALTKGQTYSADSLLPLIAEEQLRASVEAYPHAIQDKYLSLPDVITKRTRLLARDLTFNMQNPYDKARAIETYLRSYPYSLTIPSLPENREVADYFLFELKTGYCDYYATSMIVLARAAGLPARLVIGYAGGAYDARRAEYVLREADGHSWVEIFFSGVGWVEFEPTAGRPPIFIAEKLDQDIAHDEAASDFANRSQPAYTRGGNFPDRELWPIFPALFLLGFLGFLLFLNTQGILLNHRSVGSIYGFVFQQGRYFHQAARLSETPADFARALKKRLSSNLSWLRPAGQELELLTSYYLKETYSPHPLARDEHRRAVIAWRKLFWRLMLARLFNI